MRIRHPIASVRPSLPRPILQPLARAAAVVLLGLLSLPGAALRATTLARMELKDLVRQSTYIVRARCLATSFLTSSTQVWTLSTFTVTETWKGNLSSPFVVRLPGGELGGLRVAVEGAPRFTPREDVVLFLIPNASGQMNVVGWLQGTFRIRRNLRTGAPSAVQDTAGLRLFSPRSGNSSFGALRQFSLADLRARVASVLEEVRQ